MNEMTKRGYGSSGTMRQNRLFNVPFKPQKDPVTPGNLRYSEISVKRWKKERRAFDKVAQHKCTNRFNEHSWVVLTFRFQDALSGSGLRRAAGPSLHGLSTVHSVNRHFFYRDVMEGTIELLTLSQIVASSLMQKFGTKPRMEISTSRYC